jgi:hypothetical protein
MKKYGSTHGSHLKRRIEGQVNVGIVHGIGMGVEGRSNGSTRDIRSGPKRAGSDSWMIQSKENNLLAGLQKGNWYEVQSGRKRGATEWVVKANECCWMPITKPKYSPHAAPSKQENGP